MEVLVENVNDNPPNFAQNHYVLEVNEVSGVLSVVLCLFCKVKHVVLLSWQLMSVNSSVGLIEATDVDSEPLYYRLESATVRVYLLTPSATVARTLLFQ